MNHKEKLIEIINNVIRCEKCGIVPEWLAEDLIFYGVTVQERARPLEEWGEDYGDVLWWKFPIEKPPYVGSPLDENWPAYHTHWTPIILPQPPKGE